MRTNLPRVLTLCPCGKTRSDTDRNARRRPLFRSGPRHIGRNPHTCCSSVPQGPYQAQTAGWSANCMCRDASWWVDRVAADPKRSLDGPRATSPVESMVRGPCRCTFLLHSFVCEEKSRRIAIRLFKSGKFTARVRSDPALPCTRCGYGHVERGFVGRWREHPDGYVLEGYGGERRLVIRLTDGNLHTVESKWGEGCCSSDRLDSLDLVRETL